MKELGKSWWDRDNVNDRIHRNSYMSDIAKNLTPLLELLTVFFIDKKTMEEKEENQENQEKNVRQMTSLLQSLTWRRDGGGVAVVALAMVQHETFRRLVKLWTTDVAFATTSLTADLTRSILDLLDAIAHMGGNFVLLDTMSSSSRSSSSSTWGGESEGMIKSKTKNTMMETIIQEKTKNDQDNLDDLEDNPTISFLLHKMLDFNPLYSESAASTIHGLVRHGNIPLYSVNDVLKSMKKTIFYSSNADDDINTDTQEDTNDDDHHHKNHNIHNDSNDVIRATAIQATLAMAYLVGKEEKSYLSSHPKVIQDVVMVTKLALKKKRYAGHMWGVFGLILPMQMLVISDSNKKVLIRCGFVDVILYIVCGLFHQEPSAAKLLGQLKELESDLQSMDHFKMTHCLQEEDGSVVANSEFLKDPDTLQICIKLLVNLSFVDSALHRMEELSENLYPLLKVVHERKGSQVLARQLIFLLDLGDKELNLFDRRKKKKKRQKAVVQNGEEISTSHEELLTMTSKLSSKIEVAHNDKKGEDNIVEEAAETEEAEEASENERIPSGGKSMHQSVPDLSTEDEDSSDNDSEYAKASYEPIPAGRQGGGKLLRPVPACDTSSEEEESIDSDSDEDGGSPLMLNVSSPDIVRNEAKEEEEIHPTSENEEKYVMISYSWAQKETVRQFAEEVKKRGFRIWLDVDMMAGDTVEAMAEAVENASAVIMCVSKAYKESHNCRLEAMYANQLKKHIIPLMVSEEQQYRPDGWLGLLMGVKLYYDGKQPIIAAEEVCNKELTTILQEPPRDSHQLLNTRSIAVDVDKRNTMVLPASEKSLEASITSIPLQAWSKEDVLFWLDDIEFSLHKDRMKALNINGKALKELQYMRNVDPIGFHSLIRSDVMFSFHVNEALSFGFELAKRH